MYRVAREKRRMTNLDYIKTPLKTIYELMASHQ